MTRLIFISLLLTALGSCKKNAPDGVMISIENLTGSRIDSVQLFYDRTNYNYGTIFPGQATGYVFFNSLPDCPAATADSAGKRIFAGHLYPPNTYSYPRLSNGKYILQIFPNPSWPYRYDAKFIAN